MALEKDPDVIFARLLEEEVFEEIPEEPGSVRATVKFMKALEVAVVRFEEGGHGEGVEDAEELRTGILVLAYFEHMYDRKPVTEEALREATMYLKGYYDVNRDKRLEEWCMRLRLR